MMILYGLLIHTEVKKKKCVSKNFNPTLPNDEQKEILKVLEKEKGKN